MKKPSQRILAIVFIFIGFLGLDVRAQNLDAIGVTLLRAVTTNLNGAGIRVAQPEAGYDQVTNWEVNPQNSLVQQPVTLFTYISANGSTTGFPNSLSSESVHADNVAGSFYGMSGGVATNVANVDNFDANYFYSSIIEMVSPPNIGDPVVSQSFTFGNVTNDFQTNGNVSVSQQQAIDSQYDNYSAQYETLFVSAVNNQYSVSPPGTSYNCIGVGAYGGSSSVGPTLDNGRAKPDIVAPASETSYSTPLVAGAAAILMQAGLRGDGGSDTNSAADIRTIKALLLNGAVKPDDWTNYFPSPLDTRYGAGVLNVFNSYEQLVGGKQGFNFSTNISAGGAHPPAAMTNSITLSGWDFNTNASSALDDTVNHYFFNATNTPSGATFTATITLVWNRQQSQTNINNLDLFLYNCANSNLVACSTSLVDNVEHIFIPELPQGCYDLQVWKAGGPNIVSDSENYALAWNFSLPTLAISNAGTSVIVSWPIYPAGFAVESTTNLSAPDWSTNNLPPLIFTNGQNQITIPATNDVQFFRLRTPDF